METLARVLTVEIMTDNSIFQEFGDRIDEQQAVAVKKATPIERIAQLSQQRVAESTIMQIFRITQEELHEIRETELYLEAVSQAAEVKTEMPLTTDANWDKLESRALNVALASIDYQDSDTALRYAAMANRAKRHTREVKTMDDKSNSINIETINVALPQQFAEALRTLNPLAKIEEVMKQAMDPKTIDIAKPKSIEGLLNEGAEREKDDQTIMDLI